MSRGSSHRSDSFSDELPAWDEPEGRRRREKKKKAGPRRSGEEMRSHRPRPVDDDDWDDDASDWEATDLEDDLRFVAGLDDDDDDWDDDDLDDEGEEWRSRDDR